MSVVFEKISDAAKLPIKGTENSAGFDIYCAETMTIPAGGRSLVSTGLKLEECPSDIYLRVAPRSGKACKGFDVGAGVVDSDYRGEVKVLYINTTDSDVEVEEGERFAQLIPTMIRQDVRCSWKGQESIESFISKERGEGGFGSTGN